MRRNLCGGIGGLAQSRAAPSPQIGFADICYDANGNLIGDGLYVYIYDAENRLVEMRTRNHASCTNLPLTGDLRAILRYDPLGITVTRELR